MGNKTPESAIQLSSFTVGDAFYKKLTQLKRDVINLIDKPTFVERVILGDFGAGKSHFLRYLQALVASEVIELQQESTTNLPKCVIAYVELEYLEKSNHFQKKIIQGMKTIDATQTRDWFEVLKDSYYDMYEKVKNDRRLGLITNKNIEQFLSIVIFKAIEGVTAGLLNLDLFDYFSNLDSIKKLQLRLPSNRLTTEFNRIAGKANTVNRDLVQSFINASVNPTPNNRTKLEDVMTLLSEEGRLTDVVFRLLSLAGVDLIVILVDELEYMERKLDGIECLTQIKAFSDKLVLAGRKSPDIRAIKSPEDCGYPSIALRACS